MSEFRLENAVSVTRGAAAARIVPFAIYIAFLALTSVLQALDTGNTVAGIFDLRWIYVVQIGCVVLALAWFWRDYDELRRPLASTRPWSWLLTAGCGVAVFALWIHMDQGWMVIGEAKGFDPTLPAGNLDWALVAMRLLGAAVVVPVMEELFWRSFVMRWIVAQDFNAVDPARVGIKALALAAVIFGLEHQLWLAGIVAGATYGALYMFSRNLWLSVVAHGITNATLGLWVVIHHEWRFW